MNAQKGQKTQKMQFHGETPGAFHLLKQGGVSWRELAASLKTFSAGPGGRRQ